jgi:hypothetical protein
MANWIKLEDLKGKLEKFAQSKGLQISPLINSKIGISHVQINDFFKTPHIAIYETEFLFVKSKRILFVVSIDNCHENINNCEGIGYDKSTDKHTGLLIGGVISRPKECIDYVWEELSLLLDKAYKEFSKSCSNSAT